MSQVGKKPKKEALSSGVVSPNLGADYVDRLDELAAKNGTVRTTLARQLLRFAIDEMNEGRIVLPPDKAVAAPQ